MSVIGGAEIFALFLPLADRIELTDVLADIDGRHVVADPRHAADGARRSAKFIRRRTDVRPSAL